jgi:hypothetical protein
MARLLKTTAVFAATFRLWLDRECRNAGTGGADPEAL